MLAGEPQWVGSYSRATMTRLLFSRLCGGVAVLLTVVMLVAGAHAAVVVQNLGMLDPGVSGVFFRFTADQARLDDGEVIRFQVSEKAAVSTVAAQIDFLPFLGIGDFGVKLVQGTGPADDRFNTFDLLATGSLSGNALTLGSAGLLTELHYGLVFTGTLAGQFGGLYAGSYSISAVPLPPAIWLFLSALVGLVGVVRRRRKPVLSAAREKAAIGA
jgi:hypothetical protein